MSAAPKLNFHLLHSKDLSPSDLINSYLCDGFAHVCQSAGFRYDLEVNSAERLIHNPQHYFSDNMGSILGSADRLYEKKFNSVGQKSKMLMEMSAAWSKLSLPKSFSDELILVADELFTNAVFNAPVVDLKTQLNPGLSRQRTDIKMHRGKFGTMSVAFAQDRIVISCSDPYGSLNLKSYLEKVLSTYEVGADYSMNFGAGGAGIGSFIIFNSASSIYFGVRPGKETLVSCVFPLHISGKKRVMLPKHLHCIQL